MPKYSNQRIQDSVHGLMEFHGMENVVIEVNSVTREPGANADVVLIIEWRDRKCSTK